MRLQKMKLRLQFARGRGQVVIQTRGVCAIMRHIASKFDSPSS